MIGLVYYINKILSFSIYNVNLLEIIISAFVILVFFLFRTFFSRILQKAISLPLKKFDKSYEEQLISAIDIPSRFIFVIIGFWISLKILNLPVSWNTFVSHMIRSLIAFTVFWAAYRSSNLLTAFLELKAQKTETKFDDMLIPLFNKGIKIVIVIIGIIVIVEEWEYNVAGLLTGLGLGGLAFALAAKDTLANLFGSIMIMVDRPFLIGDWILTPTVEGTVEEIGFRSTKVRTFAQAQVSIPNSIMCNEPITNWSRMGKRRITYKLGLTYDTSASQMKEFVERLKTMLVSHPEVHKETIFVNFDSFGDSSLEVFLYFFTNTTNWGEFLGVKEDINLKIMGLLEDMNLSVALPSRSVYLKSVE